MDFSGRREPQKLVLLLFKEPEKMNTKKREKKGGNDAGPRNDEKIIINDGE
jgi:hypothetical protein